MKKVFKTILALAIFAIAATGLFAQETQPTPEATPKERPQRPRLMEELGLTKEQAQQIRRINAQRQPLMQEAQQRVRIAQKTLDEAIYADVADENDIKEKVKSLQLAGAEVTKVKTFTEYSIRKLLTAEQLVKFRVFRERLMNFKANKDEILPMRKLENQNRRVINRVRNP